MAGVGAIRATQSKRQHCQVNSTEAPLSSSRPSSRDGRIPGAKSVAAEFSERLAADKVGLVIESVVHRGVRGEEALGRRFGLELLHLSFASSNGEVRVLGSVIVDEPALVMEVLDPQAPYGTRVGFQPICHDPLREDRLINNQVCHELGGRPGVAIEAHGRVENLPFIIHGAPQLHALPTNRADHFVEVPARGWDGTCCPQICSNPGSELDRPTADCLIADLDPALDQQLFDVAKAQGENGNRARPHEVLCQAQIGVV
jgi:hypothetical protein